MEHQTTQSITLYQTYIKRLEKYMKDIMELHNHTTQTLQTHLTQTQSIGQIKKGTDPTQTELYLTEIQRVWLPLIQSVPESKTQTPPRAV